MEYFIWHSYRENRFRLDLFVSRKVFECDRFIFLKVLYQFPLEKEEEANRIYQKLSSAASGFIK